LPGEEGVIQLADRRLDVTHGDSKQEVRRLAAQNPHYLLTGHTHQVADLRRDSILCINPGALHRASTWTIVLLDLASDLLSVLTISNATMRT
jgi:predicted phosphodiesterase